VRDTAPNKREGHLSLPRRWPLTCGDCGALEGIRTPNLLIRSQMLYPLSYERWFQAAYLPFYR
jgi:hypothetical protein